MDVAEQLTHQKIFDPLLDSFKIDDVLLLYVLLLLVCSKEGNVLPMIMIGTFALPTTACLT